MVGTVEPRKQQLEVLNAIIRLQARGAIPTDIEIHVFGSLHPYVASTFRELLSKAPQVKYFNYAPASAIAAAYRRAMFSVFASNDEGYGLPIAESLACGVPCLTANFGAMAEVAQGGGCLTCDVNDEKVLEFPVGSYAPIVRCGSGCVKRLHAVLSATGRSARSLSKSSIWIIKEMDEQASTIEAAVIDALALQVVAALRRLQDTA